MDRTRGGSFGFAAPEADQRRRLCVFSERFVMAADPYDTLGISKSELLPVNRTVTESTI